MKAVSAFAARLVAAVLSISFVTFSGLAHAQGVLRNQAQSSAPSPSRYKAIWEPVNYAGDFDLYSVFFATGKVGWVGGAGHYNKGGVILYTTDGGEHWQIQLGDPGSNEPPFEHLYFLDAQHGWAVQSGSKLLRTSDGKNWEDAGAFPKFNPLARYAFTSPQRGIELAGYANKYKIFLTQDGGRSWKERFECVTQLQVQGLTKRLGCSLFDLSFPSERVGYAVGGGYNGGFSVVAKTEDGGASWRMIFATTDLDTGEAVFFTDEAHGIIRLRDRKLIATDDGGQTWRGIPSSALGRIRFADPSVGWSCAPRSCAVTTDGGAHWVSRDLHLPADVRSFSAPRRDRVFVVGNHGMVYRYRIVPADFSAKNIADAPPVPGYGSELDAQVTTMQATVQDLQAKASSAPGDAFVQDPGFTQDVATLETGVGGFSQQAPAFASNYRN
ncbi:MAG: YCF48-related protein, partial [Burkholderiales bacterium]